jgi:anti-sigma-K factor RskA
MTPPDDDDILAGEYALGVLEGPERAAVEARLATDAVFAQRVEFWATRLELMVSASPAEPRAAVWDNIAARLSANDDEAPAGAHVAARRWRTLALVTSAIAASLAVVLVTRPAPEPVVAVEAQPSLVASLQDGKTRDAVSIIVEQAGGRLLVTPVRLTTEDRSPELWIIPGDGTPRSLGVLRATLPSRVAVPEQHRAHIHSGATFAITLEPIGGSPTGAPTGPITASGKIIRL